jgi:LuxR family maltose regulon positive regulatory protein
MQQWFDRSTEASAAHRNANNGPPLTAAEIRVLQFLPTHLSFREIAERLHVSRNTVKTQVISSYRKLGASNRTEAVERARDLSLISTGEGAEPLNAT